MKCWQRWQSIGSKAKGQWLNYVIIWFYLQIYHFNMCLKFIWWELMNNEDERIGCNMSLFSEWCIFAVQKKVIFRWCLAGYRQRQARLYRDFALVSSAWSFSRCISGIQVCPQFFWKILRFSKLSHFWRGWTFFLTFLPETCWQQKIKGITSGQLFSRSTWSRWNCQKAARPAGSGGSSGESRHGCRRCKAQAETLRPKDRA